MKNKNIIIQTLQPINSRCKIKVQVVVNTGKNSFIKGDIFVKTCSPLPKKIYSAGNKLQYKQLIFINNDSTKKTNVVIKHYIIIVLLSQKNIQFEILTLKIDPDFRSHPFIFVYQKAARFLKKCYE